MRQDSMEELEGVPSADPQLRGEEALQGGQVVSQLLELLYLPLPCVEAQEEIQPSPVPEEGQG